jgi:hypothetical protein
MRSLNAQRAYWPVLLVLLALLLVLLVLLPGLSRR